MSNVFLARIGDVAGLNAAIAAANQATAPGTYEIDFAGDVEISAALNAINLHAGITLDIEGNNQALNGAHTVGPAVSNHQRGLFVYSGAVTINNLTIVNAEASGGSSGSGGGGAGLGGALFVANDVAYGAASAGAVTLVNVSFYGNSAVGGSSGVFGLGGGGGGLGGAGYSGGGGVGAGASGGTGGGGLGGAGIVSGAAGGGNSDDYVGFGYGGPDGGGGGGGALMLIGPIGGVGGGAGGGVGGQSILTHGGALDAVQGGFGGGGGQGGHYDPGHGYPLYYGAGGAGGFGGGGGAAGDGSKLAGLGGFGGGGGSDRLGGAAGGFGGGAGNSTLGGGGLAAGGDIFVEQGASLTIVGGVTTRGGVTGGNGAISGSALGSAIFMQGDQTLTLGTGQTAGQTTIISGEIADEKTFGGAGAVSVVVDGQGTVRLDADNNFSGGVRLDSGVLQLGSESAAGKGTISFAGAAELKLVFMGALPNKIAGFLGGDVLRWSSLAYDSRELVAYTRNAANTMGTAAILGPGGVALAAFTLQGSYSVGNFALSADSDSHLVVSYRPALAYRASVDFNGDGLTDLIWRHANGALEFWDSTAGGFAGQAGPAIGTDWRLAGAGHFNGSGADGMLWRNENGDLTTWNALNASPQVFSGNGGATYHVGLDWQVAKVGDFNGDGYTDILWRNANGAVDIWNARPGSSPAAFDFMPVIGLGADWQVAGVGDFIGSGCDGILWRNANGDVTTWNSTAAAPEVFAGNGGLAYHVGLDWQVAGVGDFNGDGHADILWRNDNGSIQFWLENPGSRAPSFTAQAVQAIGAEWQVIDVGDFNGDARADILWRNLTNDDVQIWKSQGGVSPSFAAQDLGYVGAEWQIAARSG